MASSMKSCLDLMQNYTPQILALMCAMVLLALGTFQHSVGGNEVHDKQAHITNPSFGALYVTENTLLALFMLWCLKPFANLLWEILFPMRRLLEPYAQILEKRTKSKGILKSGGFAAYGSCSETSSDGEDAFQSEKPGIPTSHIQEPMLTWQYLHPQGTAYNEGWCIWLHGTDVSTDALRTAFRNIVERHPSFRTKFTLNGDSSWTQEAIQVHQIFPHIFSQLDATADERLALRLAQEALSMPLKIFAGMSSRVGVIRVSSWKVLVYVVQHHVGTDGVSMPLLYEALSKQYTFALQPPNRGLALFASSFQPFATCSAECSTSLACKEGVKESLEWWRKQLEGVSKLDLPTDYVRKPQPTFKCIHVPLHFTPELSNRIRALAQSEGVTVFDVLLALHSTWLCKMAGQDDLIVWTGHHGRSAEQAEGAVGCFRTDVPLRLVPCGTFKQFLHVVSQVKKDGLHHCHVPTMPLLEIAGVDAQGGQNVLNYYSDRYNKAGIVSAAAKAPFADGVQASLVEFPKRSAIPDLEVSLSRDVHGCLHGHADFSADIFSQTTAECMLQYFTTMAMAAVSDASCDVSELPLLTPNQEKALDDLHGSGVEPRPNVVELLARCLKSAPDSVAVEHEPTGEQLTYAELGARVHGLAVHLSTLGIGCDVLCAIMLDRSIEMIVAIYSVWWAGGAYVPIETSATETYLNFIVEDLRMHNGKANNATPSLTLLTQSWILERRALQNYFSNTLSLDSFKPCMPDMCHVPECGFPEGNQLCYSIYTSGSTGRPKGVLLQHKGLANYIEECRLAQGVTSQDVIMQKTPYIFDVSLFEFAVPLTVAAKLLVSEHEAHKDVTYVVNAMCRSGVTVTRFVPSYLDIFLDHLKATDAGKSMQLRSVGCSGEAMHTTTCLNFLQLLPQAELYDLYGPTEGTVEVTVLPCTGKALRSGKTIGKPWGGCKIYVGNSSDCEGQGCWRRTPLGLHGELLIGGVQVGRGYLNLPEKTAKAFIQNPFSNCTDDIVYRTGDVVKWRADGQVVYIGRADNQVKLSGVRIELGEIECAVAKVPGVREGVVKMLKDEQGGTSRLVAYVAPASAASDQVTKYCREVLPHYMVPSACVGIDEWPRTASGKIDLKQLPIPPVYGEEAEHQAASFTFLSAKIQSLGLVGAMGDEEVQQHGWNSFQLMALHAEMMSNPEKFNGQMSGSPTPTEKDANKHDDLDNEVARVQVGVISIIGHIWLAMMLIVLLEWLVAYWEWYRAVPAASSFSLNDYPVVEKLNALGRFLGDPVFTLLSGIQDMTDAQAGKTGQLFRRTLLFMGICVVFTTVDRLLLQGPFVRNGWIDASWAGDTSRVCGVLNGSSFVFVRALFIPFPLLFSMGRISCIKIFGIVEWPWVCLLCSILLPALLKGLPKVDGFGDGSWINYIQASNNFITELSPYYFMYPLFVGGIRFPRPIATLKVRSTTRMCCAITIAAVVTFSTIWKVTDIENVMEVDYINSQHVRWNSWLRKVKKVDNWPLLDQMSTSFDLWAAFLLACFLLSFAAMMPVTPSPFSLMGTRVIACYLTMPLTLALAGHYCAPRYLYISGPWRSACGSVGVIATLLLILSVTTAQNVLPDGLVKWASDLGPLLKGKCNSRK